jgi:hypothetical protein
MAGLLSKQRLLRRVAATAMPPPSGGGPPPSSISGVRFFAIQYSWPKTDKRLLTKLNA